MNKTITLLLFTVSIALSFSLGKMSVDSDQNNYIKTGDATQNLPAELKDAVQFLSPWLSNSKSVTLGKFIALTPNKQNPDKFLLFFDKNAIYIEKDYFSVESNNSLLITAADKNKDSIFEHISYEHMDDKGNILGMTVDANRNGQLDTIMDYKNKKVSAWVEDAWYTITKKENAVGVIVNNVWKPVHNKNGIYYFSKISNKQFNTDSGADAPPPVN